MIRIAGGQGVFGPSSSHVMPTWTGAVAGIYGYGLLHSILFQYLIRQQTITVDYKRLFNGLVLTSIASLWRNSN
jgi:hypothetical protein